MDSMDIPEAIDEFNRTKRRQGEPVMTQKRLARLAKVSETSVSRQVSGVHGISPETEAKYRAVLRMDEAA